MCLKRLAWDGVLLALSFSAGAQTVTDGDTIKLAGVTYVAETVDQELLARNTNTLRSRTAFVWHN